jgi:hypothetical protein
MWQAGLRDHVDRGTAEYGKEGQAVKVVGTLSQRVVVGQLSDQRFEPGSGTTHLSTPPKVGAGAVFSLTGGAVHRLCYR